eukprot:TRINITY_DN13588_c0_g1_i1.p1 TRINITY_DN13588_c0_g1~~TRINITY_DN13588_c0_g1_i1.p1  ORF type:complete len:361 (+),score=45.98 TRINITY_DN13588_c0_g1_i1:35-1117(+)
MSHDPNAGRRRTQILQAHGLSKDEVWDDLLSDLQKTTSELDYASRPTSQQIRPQSVRPESVVNVRPESIINVRPESIINVRPESIQMVPTEDLDELMNALTETKPSVQSVRYSKPPVQSSHGQSMRFSNVPVNEKTYTPKAPMQAPVRPTSNAFNFRSGDYMDDLLSHIGSELSSNSVSTAAKGFCDACRKPILDGAVVSALGRSFHPEHFNCVTCAVSLVSQDFYTTGDNKPCCLRCHTSSSGLLCAHCHGPITDGQAIEVRGKRWHTNHFVCPSCQQPFPGGNYYVLNNDLTCEQCYYAAQSTKCKKCGQPIIGEVLNAMNTHWHPEHFNCNSCNKSLVGGIFFEVRGMPFCELHSNG